MEDLQVIFNLIYVGGCTIAFRWPGFIGSVVGAMIYMYFR